ncbi:hypothetical protein [Corynebacterium tuberculostearicum]|uniref:hypothetical protein n=1 Tax=Corynebacterium tuberculostearicum TaxID=38304 RepID=UPI002647CE2A|nr:hypothetical protein [Corynebacterium tuberculostearicum]WKE60350.1 hypothetical protein KAH61_04310 [Corynebacterium tuberculostearicum]
MSLKPSTLVPGLIAGAIFGLILWLGSGIFWLFLVGIIIGLVSTPLLKLAADPARSRKRRDSSFRD